MSDESLMQEIKEAIRAHGTWKLKLRTAISRGSSDASPSELRHDNLCKFGKWLHGPHINNAIKSGQSYQTIKRLHAEFHQGAARILQLALNGQKKDASAALEGKFNQLSQDLVSALTQWKSELSASPAAVNGS